MCLFSNSKKKERLLMWQKVVLRNSPDKLVCNERQLVQMSNQIAQNCLKIANDSLKLVETTKKPDVFFSRYRLAFEHTKRLCQLEPYIKFSGSKPSAALNEMLQKRQYAISLFLQRYFSDVDSKARELMTDRGKKARYQKFYDSLQEYYPEMNEENIDYIETKYRVYTKNL